MLLAVERGRRLDRALDEAELDARRRPWVQHVTFGVQRLRGRLDHFLGTVLDRPLSKARPELRAALRLGLYELLETDAPPYATLSQAVEGARALSGKGGAGLVNAVLRKLAPRCADGSWTDAFPSIAADPVAHLATWGSHPRWLVERWLARWTLDEVRDLIESNNRQPGLYLRASDGDMERLAGALSSEGVEGSVAEGAPGCIEVRGATDLETLLPRVGAFVQDPAAAWVAACVGVRPGQRIVDLCAAPGGKARALRAQGGHVVAADRSEPRIRLLRENLGARPATETPASDAPGPATGTPAADRPGSALGRVSPIPLVVADARHPPFRPVETVFVDAPCTGTGTLGRHPDGRWRTTPRTLRALAKAQAEILDAAADVVTSGGLLVYATCSLEPEENHEQIERFLRRRGDFSLEAPDGVPERLVDSGGHVEILPWRTGFDGAFAARLRRVE